MTQDAIGAALLEAFAAEGFPARFVAPTTLSISLPGVSDFTADIGNVFAEAGGVPHDELPAFAADFVSGFARGYRRKMAQVPDTSADIRHLVDSEALRIRIYSEAALADPPGLRDSLVTRPLAPGLVETVVIDLPDSIMSLGRERLGGLTENQVFGAALHASLHREPHYTKVEEVMGVPVTFIGETQRYIGCHVHVLSRYVGPARHGALVSFPLPEYLLVHEIGDVHVIAAMESMQAVTRTLIEQGEKGISSQVYWWRPGQDEPAALDDGGVPDLRPVEVEVDHQEKSITPRTAETQELIELWMRDQ
ncbi:hypothetical protein ACIBI9_33550 [Nonomuraea sp. NPDC050451]|uniref:hypothetical protein n=1 Tax=Nonomuraea sp. NPDC050451 TaxID=3364364 RepID=UPI003796D89B